MTEITISLGQMHIIPDDVEQNIASFKQMSAQAAAEGSSVLVVPELWSTGYVLEQAEHFASEQDGGIYDVIRETAHEHNLTIIGSVLEKVANGVANSLSVIKPDGKISGVYRKLHLFRLFDEEKYLQQGNDLLTLDMEWGATGFGICYDLRFPELFRRYSIQNGARVMILPAEWPLIRVNHWRSLLIARAIENQSFVIACNAAGKSGETVFGGHSMIIDPWGEIIVEGDENPALLTATIDTQAIVDISTKIPVFDDVRGDIYSV